MQAMTIRLMLGDCLDMMNDISSGSVDMICTDLPYGTTQCKWDAIISLEEIWKHYWRCLKQNGVVALTASQPFTSILVSSQIKWFRHEWIWIKNNGSNFANTVREPFKEHESVLLFSRGKWTYNKQMQERTGQGVARANRADRWTTESECYGEFGRRMDRSQRPEMRIPSSWQKFNVERGLHPTQKPVDLMEYLIRTYTMPGELVLDSCMGSGTTGVGAIKSGRRFVGIEMDEGHFNTASDRLRNTLVSSNPMQIQLPI